MNAENTDVKSAFNSLSLPEPMLKAISKMGFTAPTPIQEKAIPLILNGQDTISLAETGSGKTAAYLIPVISQMIADPTKQVMVLAPTRELATQIGDVTRALTHFTPDLKFVVLIGGMSMRQQLGNLKRTPRLIIGTPGRLMDHIRRKSLDVKKFNCLILDEADRMFDMGFAPQVNEIVRQLPTARQTLLFSATFPQEVRTLAQRVLRKPVEIEVRKDKLPPKVIIQRMVPVNMQKKNDQTLDLINAAKGLVIVFARTKHRTDRLARYLSDCGVKVTRIHGDRSQAQRTSSIVGFKSGQYRVMVATDIAARGLDVSDITDVINYDLPMNSEDYVHRIGRTGRAGQEGQALTLVAPEDMRDWISIARKMGLELPAHAKNMSASGGGGGNSGSRQGRGGGRPPGGGGSGGGGGKHRRFKPRSSGGGRGGFQARHSGGGSKSGGTQSQGRRSHS